MNGHTRVSKSKRGTKINWHYRCARKYRFGVKSPNACDVRNVNGPLIESEAWNRLVELLLDEERLFKKIEEKRKEASRKQQTLIQSISSLKMQNQNDINGQERLLDLYQDGAIKKTTYLERHDRLARKIQERQAEMLELQKHLDERAPMSPDREDELKQLRLALVERLEAANFEQKVQLLDILNVEFIYHDDTGEVLMTGVFGTQRVLPGETSNMCFTLSKTHGGYQ